MKKLFFFSALIYAVAVSAQSVRVLSDARLGNGYSPRFSEDGMTVYCLANEAQNYAEPATSDIRVDNEDLHLNLYRNGVCTRLTPHGENDYIWSSLSPNQQMILFYSRRGAAVCDLSGRVLYELGKLKSPVWFGNNYVVGHVSEDDGYNFTSAYLSIRSLDGAVNQALTAPQSMAMFPAVDARLGRVVYANPDGDIHLLQLNLTDLPIVNTLPTLEGVAPSSPRRKPAAQTAKEPKDVKIYINPGHGGHTSNDRPMKIYPFETNDPNSFWESNSNLTKGLKLDSILRELGMQTKMSRIYNEEEDDLDLDVIVSQANAFNSDFMISIHSNAGNLSNMPLMLYSGKELNDPTTYNDYYYPEIQKISRTLGNTIGNYLLENTLTNWGNKLRVEGDKTFAKNVMGWSNGYGVLRYLKVPGLLSEGAMHDYIPETYRLMNNDYRAHESWQFARAFYEYFCGKKFAHGVISGQVRDEYNKLLFPVIQCIKNTRDELNPLCGAKVTLLQGEQVIGTYTTDSLYNGVFFFWNLTPGTYTIRSEMVGFYPKEKTVVVSANKMLYEDMMMQKERSERPQVLTYSPKVNAIEDSIEVATPIEFTFSVDMLADSTAAAFSISPACEGNITFTNSQRAMTFTPAPSFAPGVEYTVTLSTKACHPDTNHPNHLAEPLTFKFRTKDRPHLVIKQTYPENGAVNLPLRPEILILTDLKLSPTNKSNANKLFTIRSDDGKQSITANSRIIKLNTAIAPFGVARFQVPSDLQPNTRYTVTIGSALVDTVDVELTYNHTFSFTTGDGQTHDINGEILEGFEAAFFTMDPVKSIGVSNKTIVTSKTYATQGTNANDISYTFSQKEEDGVLFLTPQNVTHEFTSRDTIALDIYGDLSYNDIVLEFSVDGDIQYVTLGNMDYAGWKQLSVSLEALPQGITYQWTGLKIVRGTNTLSWQGQFYIDRLIRCKAIITALDDVTSPSSAAHKTLSNGVIRIHNDQQSYSLDGKLLKGDL
ncbi:MAG: Ig-like domain-containing protein [Paludibacteraceae bacterium]|nr:Ig-like domain-containing protein [Paludibacteraceae bacterium]